MSAGVLSTFAPDGLRRELLDGAIAVLPEPTLRHQVVLGRLRAAFEEAFPADGVLVGAEIELSRFDVVRPDLCVLENRVPVLVVEVLSDPRTDRVVKRELYARAGVAEYWVVDPDADRVEVHRLTGGTYPKPDLHEVGERVCFLDTEIALRRLFRR